ncbi:MAG: GntR family transcriptional regulator [Ilumatobacteraceae bacterium]
MIIELQPDGKEPPYVQIKSAITHAIATGALSPGAPLPTIRQLAGDLDVAPNTVARAYRELEDDGLVRQRGRRGTEVAAPRLVSQVDPLARSEADEFVRQARRRGLDGAAIIALVSKAVATA